MGRQPRLGKRELGIAWYMYAWVYVPDGTTFSFVAVVIPFHENPVRIVGLKMGKGWACGTRNQIQLGQ